MKQTTQITSGVRLGHVLRITRPTHGSPLARFMRISENVVNIKTKLACPGIPPQKQLRLQEELRKLAAAASRLFSELQTDVHVPVPVA